jgi:nucleotidyltransferase substrate binding protein (TIGR01987 family)
MTKYESILQQFRQTLKRFDEVLRQPKTEFIRDSAIKRFEIVFDLGWKTLKAFLEARGTKCVSPASCFREAYRAGLIEYDEVWMKMLKDRNDAVHTYNEGLAERIYADLPRALDAFKKLEFALRNADKKD